MEARMVVFFRAVIAAALVASSSLSNATVMLDTGVTQQTIDSQNFNFIFNAVPASAGAGTLVISGRGDYSLDGIDPEEDVTWSLDSGIVSGFIDFWPVVTPGLLITTEFHVDDIEWSFTKIISATEMSKLTSDGVINLSLDIGPEVNVFDSFGNPYIRGTLAFDEVPESATLSLFGLGFGLAALVGTRRRKQ